MKFHTTSEVEEAAGVTYRTLRRWMQQGLLEQPTRTSDGRTGVRLQWTGVQLRRARRVARLRAQGMTPTAIAELLQLPPPAGSP